MKTKRRLTGILFASAALLAQAAVEVEAQVGDAGPSVLTELGMGCTGFCMQTLAPSKGAFEDLTENEKRKLREYIDGSGVESAIANLKWDRERAYLPAYAYKGLGYAVDLYRETPASDALNIATLGLSGIQTKIQTDALNKLEEMTAKTAEENYSKLVLLELDRRTNAGYILPDGTVNRKKLANIKDSDLAFVQDQEFLFSIGKPEIVALFQNEFNRKLLTETLKDTGSIRETTEQIAGKLGETSKVVMEIHGLQKKLNVQSNQTLGIVKSLDVQVNRAGNVLDAVALSTLPDAQKLALAKANLLAIDPSQLATLELSVQAQRSNGEWDEGAKRLGQIAQGLSNVPGMEDVAQFAGTASNLFDQAGNLAAAWITNDPIALFQSGLNVFGALKGLAGIGKKKGASAEAKMLKAVFEEIRKLQAQIERNHRETTQRLIQISQKLDDIEDLINKRFAELSFDVSLLQSDVAELLGDDVAGCSRLIRDYQVSEVALRTQSEGLVEFAKWFERDGRPLEFSSCMGGLANRLSVNGETAFSGILRSDILDENDGTESAIVRRSTVRRYELGVLQPFVQFVRRYADKSDLQKNVEVLYTPRSSVCEVLAWDTSFPFKTCSAPSQFKWPLPYFRTSTFNPGRGSFLSSANILLLANYAQQIGRWNTVLTENTSSAAPRVMSLAEAEEISPKTASRRTRHLEVLKGAADALDLGIGQSQLLAGIPVLEKSVKVLEEQIIPKYAQARLARNYTELNKLLRMPFPQGSQVSPNCTAGSDAWNVLCAMQANPAFASNVIRLLLVKRLNDRGKSWDEWRKSIRGPFSKNVSDLMGHDIMLSDGSGGTANAMRSLGAWAIELPRVYSVAVPDNQVLELEGSCWMNGGVPNLSEGSVDYYTRHFSSKCYLLDAFSVSSFTALQFPLEHSKFVSKKNAISRELAVYCSENPYYPSYYCSSSYATGGVKGGGH